MKQRTFYTHIMLSNKMLSDKMKKQFNNNNYKHNLHSNNLYKRQQEIAQCKLNKDRRSLLTSERNICNTDSEHVNGAVQLVFMTRTDNKH